MKALLAYMQNISIEYSSECSISIGIFVLMATHKRTRARALFFFKCVVISTAAVCYCYWETTTNWIISNLLIWFVIDEKAQAIERRISKIGGCVSLFLHSYPSAHVVEINRLRMLSCLRITNNVVTHTAIKSHFHYRPILSIFS